MEYVLKNKSGAFFQERGVPWLIAEETAKDFGSQEAAELMAEHCQRFGRVNGFTGEFWVLCREKMGHEYGYQLLSEWKV